MGEANEERTKRLIHSGRWLAALLALGATGCAPGELDDERHEVGQAKQGLEVETVNVRIPTQGTFATTFMSTTQNLTVNSQATAGATGGTPWLVNFGTGQTYVQGAGRVNGNIRSLGSVKLDAQSYVAGSIWTKGSIIKQPPVTITGGQFQGPSVNVTAQLSNWDITWGDLPGPDVVIPHAPTQTWVSNPPLPPGAYGAFDVYSRNHVYLSAGVYAFQRFNTEPEVKVHLDTSAGPIVVYVRDNYGEESWQNGVGSKGMVVTDAGSPAQLFFVFMGTKDVFVQGSWEGTIVAPNARVKLERPANPGVPGTPPSHRGAFFAKRIEVAAGQHTVRHTAYAGPFPPPPPPQYTPFEDEDCDGMSDDLEVTAGLDPADPADRSSDVDGDGVPAELELRVGGDPFDPDTDGDGILDDPDLATGRDFDGDGLAYEDDNCPDDTNPAQLDADSDGVGDVCDETAMGGDMATATAPVQVARHKSTRLWGVLDPRGRDLSRMSRDQEGLLPTGTSFRVLLDPGSGRRQITEHFNAATGARGFAATNADRQNLESAGFVEVDVLGFLSTSLPAFGSPAVIRHFSSGTGGARQDAITTDPVEASALAGAGFGELAPLGYGFVDEGHYGSARSVVRYRDAAGGALHSVARNGEGDLSDYESEGFRFRLLAEKNGWTAPLYRLRNGAGAEVLTADPAELPTLEGQGFLLEGVLGFVYAESAADTPDLLVPLTRVQGQLGFEVDTGGAPGVALGSGVRMPFDRVAGTECVGASDPLQPPDLGDADPVYANVSALYSLASACTIVRVNAGEAETPTEEALLELWQAADPQVRVDLLAKAEHALSADAQSRQAALGPFSTLDPGDCSLPVNHADVRSAVGTVTMALGTSTGEANGGTTGGSQPRSLARVRSPQCEGVDYDPTLPAGEGAAERAISARELHFRNEGGTPEFPNRVLKGNVYPSLHGVLPGPAYSPVPAANEWADIHDDVGLQLGGVRSGECTTSCTASTGQRCVGEPGTSECRAYPVVPKGALITLTGINFWDVKTAQVRFRNPDTGEVVGIVQADSFIRPGNDAPNLRCAPQLALDDEFETDPEEWVEQLFVPVNLPEGQFYVVEVLNHNGSYFPFGHDVAISPEDVASMGRTIHLCQEPQCDPPADPDAAACADLPNLAICGGANGGVWLAPPRPLEHCRQLDVDLDPDTVECPETPLVFGSGSNALIYVEEPEAEKFIQTRLVGVHCLDETGPDWAGDDELVVHFASNPTAGPSVDESIANLGSAFGVHKTSINAGNRRRNDILLGSTATRLASAGTHPMMLEWGEDDDIGWEQVAIGVLAAVGTAAATIASGGTVLVVATATAAAGGGSFIVAVAAEIPDPDDFLGRAAYTASASGVFARGTELHDSNFEPVDAFELIDGNSRVEGLEVSQHPAVDLLVYRSNSEAQDQTCASDAGCSAGQSCVLGVCVPAGFQDRSLPLQFDPTEDIPGTIERRAYRGSGAHYRGYVSTSVSGKDLNAP